MIYTVTLNPSIDYIAHVNDFQLGKLNKIQQDFKLPGGKGINVSRILKRLDYENSATGFLGGFTGNFIKEFLKSEQLQQKFITIADDTRINVKLKTETETEINGLGPTITEKEAEKLLQQFQSQLLKDDLVILSGSVPPSLPDNYYLQLIEIITSKKATFILDTTGEALLQALPYQPLLLKPNQQELAELFEIELHTIEKIIIYGKKLLEKGAQNVLVSMAGDGAVLITKEYCYAANVPIGKVKNSVGAGDSMIAGFAGTYHTKKDLLQAFTWGVACGSATAFSDDLATKEAIEKLVPTIHIQEIAE